MLTLSPAPASFPLEVSHASLNTNLAWALALALVVPGCAQDRASTYEISHIYSNVSFSITKIFFREEGGFRDYSGNIYFDAAHPKNAHMQMIVQAASIDTRIETRDRVLRSDDFFDAEHYPTLAFVSTSVRPKPGGVFDVAGDLTIHGVTRHITIPVRFLGAKRMKGWGDFVGFDTEFTHRPHRVWHQRLALEWGCAHPQQGRQHPSRYRCRPPWQRVSVSRDLSFTHEEG